MPRRAARLCPSPGCPNPPNCKKHSTAEAQHRRSTTPTKVTRDHAERARRAAAVAAHRAQHGDWCPGYRVPGHPATDLTADHPVAIARGGDPHTTRLDVLCRPCNSRKGAAR